MPHLLHIDASVQGDNSVSRKLTARAAAAWKAANPTGTVTYRDLNADQLPLLNTDANLARYVPADQRTPEQAAFADLSERLTDEIKGADQVIFGLPLYNYAAPATVKTWVDHIVFPGLSTDPASGESLLGEPRFQAIVSRGGGYGEGTPRHGWDHATDWFVKVLSTLGVEVDVIAAELTLAEVVPAMAELKPLAAESLAGAERQIDELFVAAAA